MACSWKDKAPRSVPYPWRGIVIPSVASSSEAKSLSDEIKLKGNKSFRNKDYYEALWKYHHSCFLLESHPSLKESLRVILCNSALACLKLGELNCCLIDPGIFQDKRMWYLHCIEFATRVLSMNPSKALAQKAHWRRGESLKKIFIYSTKVPEYYLEDKIGSNPRETMVMDYVQAFFIQPIDAESFYETKIFYEAILLAVEYRVTSLIPRLHSCHVQDGIPVAILKMLISYDGLKTEHLLCLLSTVQVDDVMLQYLDVSWLTPISLLRKKIYSTEVFQKLIKCGLKVPPSCVEFAVQVLPDQELKLFRLLVDSCLQKMDLINAYGIANSLGKKLFVDILKTSAEDFIQCIQDCGNFFFEEEMYEKALNEFQQTLDFSREWNLKDRASICHLNFASIFLKLKKYDKAYAHSSECIELDPQNHKGYFQRAEALNLILQSSAAGKQTHFDVVMDYLACHSLQMNVQAFCKAIILAVEHGYTNKVPKFCKKDTEGFSNDVLSYIMSTAILTENLFIFIFLKLPGSERFPYNPKLISFKTILEVTSSAQVILALVTWGVTIKEEDIIAAGIHIPDNKAMLMNLILSSCPHIPPSNESFQSAMNVACNEAIQSEKKECVIVLIRYGATPIPKHLLRVSGIELDPQIRNYLLHYSEPDVCKSTQVEVLHSQSSNETMEKSIPTHSSSLSVQFVEVDSKEEKSSSISGVDKLNSVSSNLDDVETEMPDQHSDPVDSEPDVCKSTQVEVLQSQSSNETMEKSMPTHSSSLSVQFVEVDSKEEKSSSISGVDKLNSVSSNLDDVETEMPDQHSDPVERVVIMLDKAILVNDSEFIRELKALISTASKHLVEKQLDDAYSSYSHALHVCEKNELTPEVSLLHSILASICLKLDQYLKAYDHANSSIERHNIIAEGYFFRAEASRKDFESKQHKIKKSGGLSDEDIIQDYKQSCSLHNNFYVLLEAIPFAHKQGVSCFDQECADLPDNSCIQLLQKALDRKDWTSDILAYVMKLWESKKVNCSGISLNRLLSDKKITDKLLLSQFIAHGVIVNLSNVLTAIHCLSDIKVDVFEFVCSQCGQTDKDFLLLETLKAKKIQLLFLPLE